MLLKSMRINRISQKARVERRVKKKMKKSQIKG
jgi:hypothetical protein